MNSKIVFNHFYRLKHDLCRSYILSGNDLNDQYCNLVNTTWASKVHPYFAMIFSLLSEPIELYDAIQNIAYFLELPEKEAERILMMFINNTEEIALEYEGTTNLFPRHIVIDINLEFTKSRIYTPEQFDFTEIELNKERPYLTPLTLVWMVNNTCLTNCIYCYADKRIKHSAMTIEQIKAIIKQANSLNISEFIVTGGEFFLYKDWVLLLEELMKCGYKPDLISTKVPISEGAVKKIKKYDVRIQISLDSLNEVSLMKILEVKVGYLEKIKHTIELLDAYQIKYQIATVLTKYNSSIEYLDNLHTFLSTLSHLERWEIRVAFKSLYSHKDFEEIKIKSEEISGIIHWVSEIRKKSKVNILWAPDEDTSYFKTDGGSRQFVGGRCSANMNNLVILPDGKVTICEQLYWNPLFLVGDVTQQSISEIWNSSEALNLYHAKQKLINPQSPCHSCNIYSDCMSYSNRCIANIIKAYGNDNHDYPDPRCNQAPPFIHSLQHF